MPLVELVLVLILFLSLLSPSLTHLLGKLLQ